MHQKDAIALAFAGKPIGHISFAPERFLLYLEQDDLLILMDSAHDMPACWKALEKQYGSQGWQLHRLAEKTMNKLEDSIGLEEQIAVLQSSIDEITPILARLLELAEKDK
jgi:hypothetical protein